MGHQRWTKSHYVSYEKESFTFKLQCFSRELCEKGFKWDIHWIGIYSEILVKLFFRIWWDVGSIITKENSYAFRSIWVWGITKYFKHGVDTCKSYSTELFQLTTLGVVKWGPSDADRTQVGPMLLPSTLFSGRHSYSGGISAYCWRVTVKHLFANGKPIPHSFT